MSIRKYLWLFTLVISVFFMSSYLSFDVYAEEEEEEYTITEGVSLEGIDLSGMTKAEAQAAVDGYIAGVKAGKLILTAGEDIIEISYADFGLEAAKQTTVEEALQIGRRGNIVKRYKDIEDARNKGVEYDLSFTINAEALMQILNERSGEINRDPANASIRRENGEFIITEAQNGRLVDVAATTEAVKNSIEGEWDRQDLTIAMVIGETPAERTGEQLAGIKDSLGTYTTNFSSSISNRKANIQNAAGKVNGTVLYPGEEFSFLEKVNPISAENGYYLGSAYSGGKVVQSYGGGICQVSSTLYQTVLRAELTVTERTNHSMTVSYMPLAGDATVSNPTLDFKFKNEYDSPIYIEAYADSSQITISIYGAETRPGNRTLEFYSVTEQTMAPGADIVTKDASLDEGYQEITQGAHTGYVAAFYKNVYVDGVLESTELVNRSTYQAIPRSITIGTKRSE